MRSLLAGILASLLFLALAGAASANDSTTGTLQDPDLAALRQAVDDFRSQLVSLAESCALTKADGDATAAKECAERYAALRAEFKKLREAALVLVRNQHEWAKRSQQAADELKEDSEQADAAKRDEATLAAKSAPDKLRWIDERMRQLKAAQERAQEKAQEARDAAAGLSGERQQDALAVAAKWDEKAARYADELKRFTALRAQVAASQEKKACSSTTSSCSSKDKKACASTTGSCAPSDKKACASHESSTCADLKAQLNALDEKIAYKRGKIEELKDLLAYKLAQADATTGDEREQWLALAQGVREEIDQWTGYLNDLLKQREELVRRIAATPSDSSALKDKLTQQLRSIDDLVAYKLQKVAEAKAAGDDDAVRYWTNLINDLLAQRAEVAAKLNALR